jgi:hypothetical protein
MRFNVPMTNAPSPAPVCPLDAIEAFMRRFIAFPETAHAAVLAPWVLHTYAIDAAYATPYIYITSAEKQSGKTRVIDVLDTLCRNPVKSGSISASSLYRLIDKGVPGRPGSDDDTSEDADLIVRQRPTLFIDEVDAIFTGAANEALREVLNMGYKSSGFAIRTIEGEVRQMSTFAPKLLAGIDNGHMPDTIADRCIRIVLKRKKAGQEVERFMARRVEAEAQALRDQITEWVAFHMDTIMAIEPDVLDELSDRAFEISEPLLQIATVAGSEWLARVQTALRTLLVQEDTALSLGGQVLQSAKTLLDETGSDRLSSAALCEYVNVHPKRLGNLLAPYGIKPTTIRFGKGANVTIAKGYYKRDFEDAWERYL